eukprot:11159292-Ditylum_brightwellii.AAC.1
MEAIVALWKEERELIKKRISKRKKKLYICWLQDELEDEEEDERPTKKIKHVSGSGQKFDHVKEITLTEYRHLTIPDDV